MESRKQAFAIDIELSAQQAEELAAKFRTERIGAREVAALAQTAVRELAEGGMLLDPGVTRQILALTGPIADTQDLVTFIEKARSMDDGAVAVKWRIDPTLIPWLESVAAGSGISLEQYLNNYMNYVVMNGGLGSYSPDAAILFVGHSQMNRIREIIGKPNATGTDIAEWIENLAGEPQLVE